MCKQITFDVGKAQKMPQLGVKKDMKVMTTQNDATIRHLQ